MESVKVAAQDERKARRRDFTVDYAAIHTELMVASDAFTVRDDGGIYVQTENIFKMDYVRSTT